MWVRIYQNIHLSCKGKVIVLLIVVVSNPQCALLSNDNILVNADDEFLLRNHLVPLIEILSLVFTVLIRADAILWESSTSIMQDLALTV